MMRASVVVTRLCLGRRKPKNNASSGELWLADAGLLRRQFFLDRLVQQHLDVGLIRHPLTLRERLRSRIIVNDDR